ncbi:hypothetical protein P781_16595 [Vibrio mimicus CAIM 1883]|nr:hypothetical protein P780_16640 [Vibrio mimicus CAIM 1882]ERM53529.1 hypothetical protein P781_16595 [Vibrio mimicus CAIM 1883]
MDMAVYSAQKGFINIDAVHSFLVMPMKRLLKSKNAKD